MVRQGGRVVEQWNEKGRRVVKYELLEPFREYLYSKKSSNTARTYYAAVVKLFKGVNVSRIEALPLEYFERELPLRFKTRNEFSAAKNGLKLLAEVYPKLQIPEESFFKENSLKKRNYSKKPGKVIYLQPTMRKINQMTDLRFKYAYRLAVISGLRVSELADLEAGDISFEEDRIVVTVRNGKGGHGGCINCRADPYLYEKLQQFIEEHTKQDLGQASQKLFYGEAALRREAWRLGFECHDLRRIYAIESRKELRTKLPVPEADRQVQENMRHARFSTTKRYLYNRKLKVNQDRSKEEKHE